MMIAHGASCDLADHREARRGNSGQQRHRVVPQPDLRLVEKRPEVADHRRRQHHRNQDHRGPEVVAAKAPVDQVGEREADQRLQQDRPEQEVRGRLHRGPDIGVVQDRHVVIDADVDHRRIGPVGAVVGERQPDRPDQRKDVDRQQQHDRRRDEQPRQRAVRQAAHTACHRSRGGAGDAAGQRIERAHRKWLRSAIVGAATWRSDAPEALSRATTWRSAPPADAKRAALPTRYLILPSSLKTLVQSTIRPSSASLAVPLSATT